jgi:signal peptidase
MKRATDGKILSNVLFAVSVIIFGFLVILASPSSFNHYKVLVVQSGSMEPAIKTGSVVIISPEPDYKVGDIVTYRKNGFENKTVTHRIVGMKVADDKTTYTTQGDANNGADMKNVDKSAIVGKVLLSVPYIGYAIDAARNPQGFIILIAVPSGVIIMGQVRNILKEIAAFRRRRKEEEIEKGNGDIKADPV